MLGRTWHPGLRQWRRTDESSSPGLSNPEAQANLVHD